MSRQKDRAIVGQVPVNHKHSLGHYRIQKLHLNLANQKIQFHFVLLKLFD
jgi:hypothetical protein